MHGEHRFLIYLDYQSRYYAWTTLYATLRCCPPSMMLLLFSYGTGHTADSGPAFPNRSTTSSCNANKFCTLAEPLISDEHNIFLQAGQELGTGVGAVQVDFVLSLLAMQHMIPQLQIAALEHICDVLSASGLGFVQLLTGCECGVVGQ